MNRNICFVVWMQIVLISIACGRIVDEQPQSNENDTKAFCDRGDVIAGYVDCEEETCTSSCLAPLASCLQYRQAGFDQDGVYIVDIDNDEELDPIEVYCDMKTDGGGWTLVQRSVWDWEETQALLTGYDKFREQTLGALQSGRAFRAAGRYWPLLQETEEHLFALTLREDTDGKDCQPLYYVLEGGAWSMPPSGNDAGLDAIGSWPSATSERSTADNDYDNCGSESSAEALTPLPPSYWKRKSSPRQILVMSANL